MNWKIFSLAVLVVLSLSVAYYDLRVFSSEYDLLIGVRSWDAVQNAIPIEDFYSASSSGQPAVEVSELRALLLGGVTIGEWIKIPAGDANSYSTINGWAEAMYKKYVGQQAVPESLRIEAAFYIRDGNNYYLVELWKYPVGVPPLYLTVAFNVVTVILWLAFGYREKEPKLPE
jgi:hypothetical protein